MEVNSRLRFGSFDRDGFHSGCREDSNIESWAQGFMEQRAFPAGIAVRKTLHEVE